MVDLVQQYKQIKQEIASAMMEVIESSAFINGPAVYRFQKNLKEYLGCRHVIPCANGTDAIKISLMALELNPGDEIITTPFTFVSTVEVIVLLKLRPVLVDIDPDTFNISPRLIERAVTSRTKAIIPVHLFGQCADMESIMNIARKHNLYVIEDSCQSIGSDYIFSDGSRKKSGTIGHIGCISFFPSKNLGAYGDGGAICTNDDNLEKFLRCIANHGMINRYHYEMVGLNSRLDSLQAAVLDIKLKYIEKYISLRRNAADYYNKQFSNIPGLTIPVTSAFTTHVYHQYTLATDNSCRDKLINYLSEKNIPSAIYYPLPLHLQKAYSFLGYREGDFPVSEEMSHRVFSIPMHPELTEEQLNYICNNIKEFFDN